MKHINEENTKAILATLDTQIGYFSDQIYPLHLGKGEPLKPIFLLYSCVYEMFAENNGYDIVNDLLSAFNGAAFINTSNTLVRYSDEKDGERLPKTVTLNRVDFANLFFRMQEVCVFLLKLEHLEKQVFETQTIRKA